MFILWHHERRTGRSTFIFERPERRMGRSTFVSGRSERRTERSTFVFGRPKRRTDRSTFVFGRPRRRMGRLRENLSETPHGGKHKLRKKSRGARGASGAGHNGEAHEPQSGGGFTSLPFARWHAVRGTPTPNAEHAVIGQRADRGNNSWRSGAIAPMAA